MTTGRINQVSTWTADPPPQRRASERKRSEMTATTRHPTSSTNHRPRTATVKVTTGSFDQRRSRSQFQIQRITKERLWSESRISTDPRFSNSPLSWVPTHPLSSTTHFSMSLNTHIEAAVWNTTSVSKAAPEPRRHQPHTTSVTVGSRSDSFVNRMR